MALTPLTPLLLSLVQATAPSPQAASGNLGSLPGNAQIEWLQANLYRVIRQGQVGPLRTLNPLLELRKGRVDPLAPSFLVTREEARRIAQTLTHQGRAHLVQFATHLLPEHLEALAALGIGTTVPVPEQSMVVLMDRSLRGRVEALPFVRWVGPYLPTHKLEEGLDELIESGQAQAQPYHVMALDPGLMPALVGRLQALGIPAEAGKGSLRLQATLDPVQLQRVSQLDEVLFIDRVTPFADDMDLVRASSGVPALASVAGYQGQGVRGEICETKGFRATHTAFQANPPTVLANHATIDHGTAVTSSAFGGGNASGQYLGTLPKGTPYFISLYSLNGGVYPTNAQRRAHVAQMVDPAGPYRIVFQTYSNGTTVTTAYTTDAAEWDSILFDTDLLAFNSQGNENGNNSRPQAWAKNVVSVGGMDSKGTLDTADDTNARASTGYAADGRIKPDLAHYYTVTTASATSDTAFASISGTSFSTPATAGISGLFFQMWADGVFSGGPGRNRDVFASRPHAATAKAILVNTAKQWTFTGTTSTRDRKFQGWGMADAKGMYDTAQAHSWGLPILVDESAPIGPQQVHSHTLTCNGTKPLKATLVYRDPAGNPSAAKARMNNLDLKVTSPSGVVYWGNNGLKAGIWSASGGTASDVDTVENVFIERPEAGAWTIQVLGTEILVDGHKATSALDAVYALVAQGGTTGGTTQPLAWLTQPASQTVIAGQTASFSASATGGTPPYAWEWLRNGSPVSGATAATYTFTAAAADHGATFAARVTDAASTRLTSTAATLTVNVAPAITTQPASQTVSVGQTATFTVVASGTAPLSYQWMKNGAALAGATSASYTTPATTAADSGASFTVTVSNVAGSTTSAAASLTVNTTTVAPAITTQPANQTVTVGQTATFTVVASGTAPLSYQWMKNGAALAGATSASYTTPATTAADSGTMFSVTVSNAAGSATSANAVLTVTGGSQTTQNEVEPNDSRTAANLIPNRDTKVLGALGTTSDKDYFRVNLPAGATLASTLTLPATANFDLFLYDSGGSALATSKNAKGVAESLSWKNATTATKDVYLSIKPVSGTVAGSWTLTAKW